MTSITFLGLLWWRAPVGRAPAPSARDADSPASSTRSPVQVLAHDCDTAAVEVPHCWDHGNCSMGGSRACQRRYWSRRPSSPLEIIDAMSNSWACNRWAHRPVGKLARRQARKAEQPINCLLQTNWRPSHQVSGRCWLTIDSAAVWTLASGWNSARCSHSRTSTFQPPIQHHRSSRQSR